MRIFCLAMMSILSAAGTGRAQATVTEEAKLTASDPGVQDLYGLSLVVLGNTALVGAPSDDHLGASGAGSSYVFVRAGSGWTEQQKLIASDASTGDMFGQSVALSPDAALIGAPGDDHSQVLSGGSAYVFVRNGTSWSEAAKLTSSAPGAYDSFGDSVALQDNNALVGAPGANGFAGEVRVFTRIGASWIEQALLTASDSAALDGFGNSLALSGTTALVGAQVDDHSAGADAGAAYVFVRRGVSWSEQAKLVGSDTRSLDYFGTSVALLGDTALVGASLNDPLGGLDQGAAYVFTRRGTTWREQAKLVASDGGPFDRFGGSVALVEGMAVIGATGYDGDTSDTGIAYAFARDGLAWKERARLAPSDAMSNDLFGFGVAASPGTVLVSAPFASAGGVPDAGAAYAFRLSAGRYSLPPMERR